MPWIFVTHNTYTYHIDEFLYFVELFLHLIARGHFFRYKREVEGEGVGFSPSPPGKQAVSRQYADSKQTLSRH